MTNGYGQFCSIARALELLGERWTLLVVRELLCGSRTFGDVRRGIPRISRTMLSERLRTLRDAGVITRSDDASTPTYSLTPAGEALASVVRELGTWGHRFLPRELSANELDVDALLWDMRRRVLHEALPPRPVLARIDTSRSRRTETRYLLLRRTEVSLCTTNPGFPESLRLTTPLAVLTGWWRGDLSFDAARASGLAVTGSRTLVRAFPTWFARYAFAHVV